MRRILIGASVMVLATSSLVAAPKKKKTPTTKKDKTKDQGAGSGAEIEMDGGGAGSGGAGGGMGGGSGSDASMSKPPPEPTPAPVGVRSLDLNERPLTLPKGQIDVHGALPIALVTVPDITGGKTSSTSLGFAFGGTYGLDDKTELGADYAVSLSPGDIKGPLTLHGAYTLAKAPKYDAAIGGALVIHPIGSTDPMSGASATTTYLALQIGAWFRYRATPKVTIFTGLPATPHPDVSLSRAGFAFPPMPYQLTLGVNNGGAIALNLPVGVGIQAAPRIYVFAATNIANIKIAHTANAFLFADFIPLTLGGFYSLPKLDVGAEFSDDLKQAGDYLAFTIVARYFIK
jgi:hypothetical protein